MINEKLINKINRNLNSYSVNEATNTEYDTTQVLVVYLLQTQIAHIPITPQTSLKDSEAPSTKSIPDFTIGLITPTKKTIENAETFFRKMHRVIM